MAGKPELYSVWQDSAGERFIVTYVNDEPDDPDFWLASLVAYDDRFEPSGMADELDPEEWAAHVAADGLTQVGVEPGEYPI